MLNLYKLARRPAGWVLGDEFTKAGIRYRVTRAGRNVVWAAQVEKSKPWASAEIVEGTERAFTLYGRGQGRAK